MSKTSIISESELRRKIAVLRADHQAGQALALIETVHEDLPSGDHSALIPTQVDLLKDLGRFDAAIRVLERAEQSNPMFKLHFKILRFDLLSLLERWDEARSLLDGIVAEWPKTDKYPNLVIRALSDFGEWDKLRRLLSEGNAERLGKYATRTNMVVASRALMNQLEPREPDNLVGWKDLFQRLGEIDGYRHNYILPDGSKLFDFASVKENSPGEDKDFNLLEWRLIRDLTPDLSGMRVLDLGAADGFFSVRSILEGAASVDCLELDPLFMMRAMMFARFHRVADRVIPRRLAFDRAFGKRFGRYDIVLALGLIYHLHNLYLGLSNLCELSDRIIIETMTADVHWDNDVPALRFADSDPLDLDWVKGFFTDRGYQYWESAEWADFADRHERSKGRRLLYFERKSDNSA